MKPRKKDKLVIVEFPDGLRIAFCTDYPLPHYFSVKLKGQEILHVDRKGLRAIAEIWIS